MNKKRVFVLIALCMLLFFLIQGVFAVENSTEDKAYTCLEGRVEDKCDELTVEEQAFSSMALGECKSELLENSDSDKCWPKTSCKLRDTALAIIALDRVNGDKKKAEEWLLSQNTTPKNLDWYLEIDATEESSCSIEYSGKDYEIDVNSEKELSSGAGKCLSLYNMGYWLKISDSCLNVNFTISCDKSFKTALLYRKSGSDTIYVSSKTNSASAGGETEEKVDAICFKQGKDCDYEGSLWATFALSRNKDIDVSPFLPYLTAFSMDNKKFFPESLLYLLTEDQEYLSEITSSQKPGDFWHAESSPYTELYDTALALFALQKTGATEIDEAISYLEDKQQSDGCFGGIRDTAFLLYALWPRTPSTLGGPELSDCEEYEKYCVTRAECEEAEGQQLDNYDCISEPSKICCSEPRKEPKTCDELEGVLMSTCKSNEECSGNQVESSGGMCCRGRCVEKQVEKTECETAGHTCRDKCLKTEESTTDDCNLGEVCCMPKQEPGGSYWWIWLLVVLIILVLLGIIFRKKLQMFLFKLKKGKGKGAAEQRRPPFPPPATEARGRFMPRRMIPMPFGRRPVPRPVPASESDKELEETFKKLKKMSE